MVATPQRGQRSQRGDLSPWPWCVKFADDVYSLDSPIYQLDVDESAMSASNILATTVRDRQGDILETDGISLTAHRANPVVLWDHGRQHTLPIGKTESPSGLYTVNRGNDVLTEKTYFSQSSPVAMQVFALIAEKTIRANSIGFRKILAKELASDPSRGFVPGMQGKGTPAGLHVIESELAEVTWCAVGQNPEAVAKALGRKWDGKFLDESIASTLCLLLPPRKIWTHGFRPLCKDMVAATSTPMSASNQAGGGSFVPPPTVGHGAKLKRNRKVFMSGFKCRLRGN